MMPRVLIISIAFALLLLSGCSTARAATRYQAQDGSTLTQPRQWTFDLEPSSGTLPVGSIFSGTWVARAEMDAPSQPNALCQTGTAQYPALLLGDAVFNDVALATRFKPISGREDQAAGLIFRVQDKDNYYILRANALENNVNFYKYAGGQRSVIKEGSASVASGQWQELRVEASGNRLRGFLNGQHVVEAADDTYQAGMVGLWTKADSVTCFDDVEAGPVTAEQPSLPVAQGVTVGMISEGDSRRFEPADLTISKGTTVTWQHVSGSAHTATADPSRSRDPSHISLPDGVEPWDSGDLTSGQSWSRTFDVPGIYRYFCAPHEGRGMLGTITVTD